MSKRLGPSKANASPPRMRSLLMSRVRRSGTAPEVALRSALHRAGYRYRINSGQRAPGNAGCGTSAISGRHFCRRLLLARLPSTWFTARTANGDFWTSKILRNQRRDKKVDRSLRRLGWRVLRVWEHDIRVPLGRVISRVDRLTRNKRQPHE